MVPYSNSKLTIHLHYTAVFKEIVFSLLEEFREIEFQPVPDVTFTHS